MAITRQQKEQHVSEIKELVSKAHSIIVWDYLGLNATEIQDLRSNIRKAGAQNTVYKNRIAKIALEQSGKKEILEYLTGPSSFLFTFDDNPTSLKEILKVSKDTEGKIEFKAGYIDGKFFTAEGVREIASLPSKDDLLSMLLSVLQANIRNFAYSLSQVAEKAPAEEPKVEEVQEENVSAEEKPKVEEPKEESLSTKELTTEETTKDDKEESAIEETKEEESAPKEKVEEETPKEDKGE